MSSREDLKNFQLQLDQVNDGLSLAPDDQDLLDLKTELTDLIGLLKEQLKSEQAEQEAKQRKWQQKKQPTIQPPTKTDSPIPPSDASTQSPEPPSLPPNSKPEHVIFKVGDVVSAKWVAGDGGYYPAKITQVTGSSSLPYYTVQYLKWDNTMETLPAYSVKAIADDKKRKVTAAGFDKPPPQPKKIDPQVKEAAEEKKRRRLREKQELERTKQNWQNFATKGPKKRSGAVGKTVPIGSNSMFKTPESHSGRGVFPPSPFF
jgi:survival of motor neuron-related-splicing factor 30